jgi:hypothetical protein
MRKWVNQKPHLRIHACTHSRTTSDRNPWLMACSTIVEDPLQIGPFYAKQSQFAESENECKLNNNKGL